MANSRLRPSGDTFDNIDAIRQNVPERADALRALLSTTKSFSAGDSARQALAQEAAGDPNWEATRDDYARAAEEQAALAPRVRSLRDIGGLGDATDFAQQALVSGMTSTVPALAAGILTRGRSPLAAYAGAAIPSYMLSKGEIAAEQYGDPTLAAAPVEERVKAATTGGVVNAALESLVPGSLANAMFRKPTTSYLGNVGREMLTEGATEAAQTGVEHLAAKHLDPTRELDLMSIADAAAQGALGGGGLTAAAMAPTYLAGSIRDRVAQRQAAETAPPPDETGGQLALPAPDATGGPGTGMVPNPETLMLTGNEFAPEFEEVDSDIKRTPGEYVKDTLNKAKEAYAKGGTAADFVNSVFGSIKDDIANLGQDPNDASLAGATPEETIQKINVADAAKLQSAQRVAETLLMDDSIPPLFKDRIANLNGDYSSPTSQQYIHALANGKRIATQMSSALEGLSKLAKGVKFNLQEFDSADIQPLVVSLAQKLGPAEAAKAPELARQLMAVSARMSDATDMTGADQHLKNLSEAVDDETLDLITEMSGSDALRKAITRTREIPSASNDVRKSGGNSFLESVLVDKNIPVTQREGIAEFIDTSSVGFANLNDTRKNRILNDLTPIFGSPKTAAAVLEYYGGLQRKAAEVSKVVTPDDRPAATVETPEMAESHEKLVEFGDMTEKDGQKFRYGFRQASSERPFRKFGRKNPGDATEGQIARDRMKGVAANSRTHLVPYSEYLAEKGVDEKAGVAFVRADIKKRIKDHKAKGNRAKQILDLRGELMVFDDMVKAAGDKRALDLYEVLRHGESSTEDKVDTVTDADIPKMQVSNDKYPESVLTFRKADGKTLKLSAISMIKHQGNKRKASGKVLSPTQSTPEEQLYEAIAGVLARGDLTLETKLDDKVQIRAFEEGTEGRTLPSNKPKEEEAQRERHPLRAEAEAMYAEDNDAEQDPENADAPKQAYVPFIAEMLERFEAALEWADTPNIRPVIARDAKDILDEMEERSAEAFKRRDKAKVTKNSLLSEAKGKKAKKGAPEWTEYFMAAGRYDFEAARAKAFHKAVKDMTYLLETHNAEESRDDGGTPEMTKFVENANQKEADTPIWRGDQDKNAEIKLQPLIKNDAMLEANPELLTVYDSLGRPKDPSWSMNKVRERLVTAYQGIGTVALKRRLAEIQKRLTGKLPDDTANAYRLLEQVIGNIITKREDSGSDKKAEIKAANKAAKAPAAPLTGLARMEKLVADDKAVKRDGVYYLTDAAASKRVSGVTSDGHVYVNLAKLKEGGLLAALKDSPTKTAALNNPKLGITAEELVAELGNVRRQASFLRDYEIARAKALKVTGGSQTDRYPRKPDGTPWTTAPRAIDIESTLILDALTAGEVSKLAALAIVRRKANEKRIAKNAAARAKRQAAKAKPETKYNRQAADINRAIHGDDPTKIAVAHNSPHKVGGKFDWESHRGKGEGSAAFSEGHYVSTSDATSRHYKWLFSKEERYEDKLDRAKESLAFGLDQLRLMDEVSKTAPFVLGGKAFDTEDAAYAWRDENGVNRAISDRAELEARVARDRAFLAGNFEQGKSPTYALTLDAQPDELLHWHKKLSEQNPGVVERLVRDKLVARLIGAGPTLGHRDVLIAAGMSEAEVQEIEAKVRKLPLTGEEVYNALKKHFNGDGIKASQYLRDELGFVAMEHYAQGGSQRDFPNYAVWNTDRLTQNYVHFNRQSSQTPNKKRASNNPKREAAIEAELEKILGPNLKIRFGKFAGFSGSYQWNDTLKKHLIRIARNAGNMEQVGWHEALHGFFYALGENANLRTVRRDLMAAASTPAAMKKLRELLKGHPKALEQIETDMEERAAYMFQFWSAGLMPEIGETGTNLFQRLFKMVRELVGLASVDERALELMTRLKDGEFADMSVAGEVIKDMKAKTLTNRLEALAPSIVANAAKLYTAGPDRLRAFSVPELSALAEEFSSERGKLGMVQRRFKQNGAWQNRLGKILEGTTAVGRRKAIDNLQSMKAPSSKLEKDLAKYFEDMYDYMDKAGVQRFDPKSQTWVPVNKLGGYFPRAWDANTIRANRTAWEALLAKNGVSQGQIKKTTDAIIKGDGHLDLVEGKGHLGYTPFAAGVQNRQFTFIKPSNAAEFAKFQQKDLADVVMPYTHQAVHRAEYARSFGNNGEKIQTALDSSRLNSAEKAEVMTVVRGLEGTLDGNGLSQDTKATMSRVMTAQNMILLPLALFSQMIDPIVLAARSGHLADAGAAYVTAVQRLRGKDSKRNADLAKMLGIISADSTLEAMGMSYGSSYMSPGARNVNRMFFKYNGMQLWNDSMRIAATVAGEGYLIENIKNKAVLAELGLEAGDIVHRGGRLILTAEALAAKKKRAVTPDDEAQATRLQEAMFRFVDSAVIRPSASQRPTWMSDPRFMLVGHLKQFTFAMHNVVLKRAQYELEHNDNVKPSAILMLTIPTILAADMVKMMFTGAPPGWGYMDYLKHAVERSGLLGLGDFGTAIENDVQRGKAPGEGLLGPAVEHLLSVLRWMFNDPGTSFDDVINRTIPGARYV